MNQGNSYTSQAPYGYDYNSELKKLFVNAEQSETVKRIFQLCIDGFSTSRIANTLNADAMLNNGKQWSFKRIVSILNNTVYYGEVDYVTKAVKKEGKTTRHILETKKVSTPSIITKEVFDAAQESLDTRKCRSKSVEPKYNTLLRGLIICPVCGRRYTYLRDKDSYRCSSKSDKIKCESKLIKAKYLDYMVWNVTNLVFFEDLRAKQIEEDVTPIMLEVAEYEAKLEGYNKLSDAKLKEAKAIVNAAIQIKIQFPKMNELYNDKLSEAAEMDKLVSN